MCVCVWAIKSLELDFLMSNQIESRSQAANWKQICRHVWIQTNTPMELRTNLFQLPQSFTPIADNAHAAPPFISCKSLRKKKHTHTQMMENTSFFHFLTMWNIKLCSMFVFHSLFHSIRFSSANDSAVWHLIGEFLQLSFPQQGQRTHNGLITLPR